MACAAYSMGKSLGIREIRVSKTYAGPTYARTYLHVGMNPLVSFVGCQKWSLLPPTHIRKSRRPSCWGFSAKALEGSSEDFEPSASSSSGIGDATGKSAPPVFQFMKGRNLDLLQA